MGEYVECPFCKETDFDLIGLKEHFERGYCEVYNETPDSVVNQSSTEQKEG